MSGTDGEEGRDVRVLRGKLWSSSTQTPHPAEGERKDKEMR